MEIVGRVPVIEAAERALANDRCAGILVTGEAGVGTSTVAAELVRRRGGDPGLARVGPAVGGSAGVTVVDGAERRRVTASEFAAVLDRRATPAILLLERVDTLDTDSVDVAMEAARAGDLQFVATLRRHDTPPPSLTRLIADGLVERIPCVPFDEEATAAMAAELIGAPLTRRSTVLLHGATGGVARLVREVVFAALDVDALGAAGGQCILERIPADAARLRASTELLLSDVDQEDREALFVIAATQPTTVAELDGAVSEDTIERLRRTDIVRCELVGRRLQVTLRHSLHAEVLTAIASPQLVRTLRGRVVQRIDGWERRRRDDRLRLALWSLAGDCEVDAATLVDASRTQHAQGAFGVAAALARAAFEQSPSYETGRALEPPLYELGDPEASEAHRERWEPHAETVEQFATIARCAAANRYWRAGRDDAVDKLTAVAERIDPGLLRDEVIAQIASLRITEGRIDDAVFLAEPLLTATPGQTQIHATLAVAHGWRSQGRPESAATVVERVVAAYRAAGPEPYVVSRSVLGNIEVHALAEAGRFGDAETLAAETLQVAREARQLTGIGLAHLALGWSYVLGGRMLDADAELAEAEGWLAEARHPGMVRWALIARALGWLQAGDLERGLELRDRLRAIGPHPAAIFEANLARVDAWIAARTGHPETAVDHLRRGAADARRLGNVVNAIGCAHDLARLGRPEVGLAVIGDTDHGGRIGVDDVEGCFLQAQIASIEALAGGELVRLQDCAQQLAGDGLDHFAAECAEAVASILARRNDRRGAAEWLRRASEFRPDLNGARHTAPTLEIAAALTDREREIVQLAAGGVSSREIGRRLSISARTVDNHLARAYRKLGVRSRVELAELLTAGAD